LLLGLSVILSAAPVTADATEWGTVKFRIRCPDAAAGNLPNDGSLEVDLPTGGVAGVVYWVRGGVSRVHPSYDFTANDIVTIQFDGDHIRPRVASYRSGQSLVFQSVFNDTHAPVFYAAGLSALLLPNASLQVGVPRAKILPQEITCSIHPKARAYLKILDHPYGDVTDPDGSAALHNLPIGVHELQLWHERVGFLNIWKPDQPAPATANGRIRVTVKPGVTDLGDFVVPRIEFR